MNEIEIAVRTYASKELTFRCVIGSCYALPANVRYFVRHTVGPYGTHWLDRSANKPKTLVAAELVAFLDEHLHSQADTEQRLLGGDMIDDRLIQAPTR